MEDQHYNGDVWNHKAFALLKMFGWKRIGDYDMDVQGDDGKKMGVDTIVKFETPLKTKPQLAVLEAKRYETKSFNKNLLQDWIERLDKKLLKLRNSEDFVEKFSCVEECTVSDTGIIAIWFSDTDNYKSFYPKFQEALTQVSVSTRTRRAGVNKIFVIDNTRFIRLFALQYAIQRIKESKQGVFNFLYSPRFISNEPLARLETLTIEYIFSDIVFAEMKSPHKTTSFIFYFGRLDINSFRLVRNAYARTSLWDKSIEIILYVYNVDDEFRKIEDDIINEVFEGFTISIKKMAYNNSIPDFLLNLQDYEQE